MPPASSSCSARTVTANWRTLELSTRPTVRGSVSTGLVSRPEHRRRSSSRSPWTPPATSVSPATRSRTSSRSTSPCAAGRWRHGNDRSWTTNQVEVASSATGATFTVLSSTASVKVDGVAITDYDSSETDHPALRHLGGVPAYASRGLRLARRQPTIEPNVFARRRVFTVDPRTDGDIPGRQGSWTRRPVSLFVDGSTDRARLTTCASTALHPTPVSNGVLSLWTPTIAAADARPPDPAGTASDRLGHQCNS